MCNQGQWRIAGVPWAAQCDPVHSRADRRAWSRWSRRRALLTPLVRWRARPDATLASARPRWSQAASSSSTCRVSTLPSTLRCRCSPSRSSSTFSTTRRTCAVPCSWLHSPPSMRSTTTGGGRFKLASASSGKSLSS